MNPRIVQCGGESLFWLILVLATIVAQIIKAGKRMSRNQHHMPEREGAHPVPPDELQEFLASLRRPEGEEPPARTGARPATPVAAVSARPPPPVPRVPAARLAPVPALQRPRPAQRGRVPPAPARVPPALSRRLPKRADVLSEPAGGYAVKRRKAIVGRLRRPRSARSAMVLRDVLGPPLALRPPSVSAGAEPR